MNEVELKKLDDEMLGAYVDQNTDLILSHCSDDIVMDDFGAEPASGKDACRAYLEQQFSEMSDSKATQTKRIIGDNAVFAELAWTATNTGNLHMPDGSTIPATGKTVNTRVSYYAHVNDAGKVDEIHGYPDIMDMMGQLGLMG